MDDPAKRMMETLREPLRIAAKAFVGSKTGDELYRRLRAVIEANAGEGYDVAVGPGDSPDTVKVVVSRRQPLVITFVLGSDGKIKSL